MGNDDPFDPKYSFGLLGLIGNNTPPKTENALTSAAFPSPGISALARALTGSPPSSGGAVSDLFGSGLSGSVFGAAYDLGLLSQPPRTNPFGSFSDLVDPPPSAPFGFGGALSPFLSPSNPPPPSPGLSALSPFLSPIDLPAPLYSPPRTQPAALSVKRRAFFSFHYDDIWRVNVVRNVWKIDHPHSEFNRSFYDSSLWESKKLEGEEAIKRLIREGVGYTSAVCVLAGAETWLRQWVRYEIARAIVDGRGLLTVHLNGIKHHVSKTAHAKGPNPLDYMAIGKVQEKAWEPSRYYLFEKQPMQDATGAWRFGWFRYSDYTFAVELPAWVTEPATGYVTPLSHCAAEYDYIADNGHQNIGSWIDQAAKRAGR
jgi:hypothetical protein